MTGCELIELIMLALASYVLIQFTDGPFSKRPSMLR